MIQTIFSELTKNLNTGVFFAGVIFGGALVVSFVVVCSYISRYWKQALLLTAITATAALVALAF